MTETNNQVQQQAIPPQQAPMVAPVTGGAMPVADVVSAVNATAANPTASTSLYVGDLHPDILEATLFEKFNAIGPVASIRVCRDAITRRSLGYAYVNYQQAEHAEKALDLMNFEVLNGRPVRIMWSQRDPTMRRSGVGNIFIKNLDESIDNKALCDTFSQFGNILSCKVVCDPEGKSRGFAFVHFETEEEAQGAIETVNGKLLVDKKVYVGPFKSRRERTEELGRQEQNFTNVYIKNLPDDITEEKFDEMVGAYGTVSSRKLMAAEDGKITGFAFVAYEDAESAHKCVSAMNGMKIGEKELYAGRAQKKAERLASLRREYEKRREEMQSRFKGVNLYVKNLDDSIDDEKLRQTFADFGNITSAKVMRDDKTGVSKGFGFVCFSQADEATKAVSEMGGKLLQGKPLYVALAQRKDERRQQLAAQHNQRIQAARMAQQYIPGGMMPPHAGQMPYLTMMQQMQGGPRGFPYAMAPRGRGGYQMQPGMMQPMAPGQYRGQPMPQQMAMNMGRGGPRGRGQQQPKRTQQQPNSQYRQQARNVPQQMPVGGMGMPQQQMPDMGQGQDTDNSGLASQLASASKDEQKEILGNHLFPLICKHVNDDGEQAGKITGMLLEMDNSELLHLLEENTALSAKVDEAKKVLKQHAQKASE